MLNEDRIIQPTDFYLGIEDLVTRELFFDLMGWQDRKRGYFETKYRISYFHYRFCEKLTTVLGVKMYALSKGLISLGAIALARKYELCERQIKTVEVDCAGSSKVHKEKLIKESTKGIEDVMFNGRAAAELRRVASKYRYNKYAKLMLPALVEDAEIIPHAKLEISKELKGNCKQITNICLDDRMFMLKQSKENYSAKTRISSIIELINQEIRQKVRPMDSLANCICGEFVTGIYIFAMWMLKNKLSGIDEIQIGAMTREIRMIIAAYDNNNHVE